MYIIQNLLNQISLITQKNKAYIEATGLNFNMFKICGVNHYENTHSSIIAEFLSPRGSHSFKYEFLKSFIDTLGSEFLLDHFNAETSKVYTEYSMSDGRIDILIEDDQNNAIIIENKIYAEDQPEQLIRYSNFGKNKYGDSKFQILYLTLDGANASEQSSKNVLYTSISYHTTIIEWLKHCLQLSAMHAGVRETLNQYINHLKTLTNQDMNTRNIEEISKIILSSTENVEAMFQLNKATEDVKRSLSEKFGKYFVELFEIHPHPKGSRWGLISSKINLYEGGLVFEFDDAKFKLEWTSQSGGYYGFSLVYGYDNKKDILTDTLSKLGYTSNKWWLGWKWNPSIIDWKLEETFISIVNDRECKKRAKELLDFLKLEIEKIIEEMNRIK